MRAFEEDGLLELSSASPINTRRTQARGDEAGPYRFIWARET